MSRATVDLTEPELVDYGDIKLRRTNCNQRHYRLRPIAEFNAAIIAGLPRTGTGCT